LDDLSKARLIDEDTVLPAVPLWWHELDDDRAQSEIEHLGSGAMEADWGMRILSDTSPLYDPLSYHYGSVWPLFTGWASVAAYRYGRPHTGFQALTSNALLTYSNALGYVTELLSGAFNAPFGRSSHHQVWSEAMVVAPVLRGLFGIEVSGGGKTLRFAPQLPANWDRVSVTNVPAGRWRYDLALERSAGRERIAIGRREQAKSEAAKGPEASGLTRIIVAPAFPLDARVRAATVNHSHGKFSITRSGDIERAEVTIESPAPTVEVVFAYDEGTDVYSPPEALEAGARSKGLRIIHSRADANALHLTLEGIGGRSYSLRVRTGRELGEARDRGLMIKRLAGQDPELLVTFEGAGDAYVRRELSIPLLERKSESR